ncbi:MAG TPA: anti-sigma factor [Candidatus Baltobacteraceae bacterium]|nr:anti-sigma factor [Candidatus Baltobacteraceae bacterium]
MSTPKATHAPERRQPTLRRDARASQREHRASGTQPQNQFFHARIVRREWSNLFDAKLLEVTQDRPPVWPAYLVAAACLAIAILSSIVDLALTGQLKQTQNRLAAQTQHSNVLSRNLAETRTTLSDLLSTDSKRYVIGNGEIVTRGSHLYIAMHDLGEPPRGKVYQAWTLAKGARKVAPSLTFVPDARGVAVVALPVDARSTVAIAVSIEPEGGSRQPTAKPIVIVPLT